MELIGNAITLPGTWYRLTGDRDINVRILDGYIVAANDWRASAYPVETWLADPYWLYNGN